jgi:hypothetical protein
MAKLSLLKAHNPYQDQNLLSKDTAGVMVHRPVLHHILDFIL